MKNAEIHAIVFIFFMLIVIIGVLFTANSFGQEDYSLTTEEGVVYCCSFEYDGEAKFCIAREPHTCEVCESICGQ